MRINNFITYDNIQRLFSIYSRYYARFAPVSLGLYCLRVNGKTRKISGA